MTEPSKAFKGIWIPKVISEDTRLTAMHKMLLAEVDSLDHGEGCFATNEYLANRIGTTRGNVAQMFVYLRTLGLVIDRGMKNGRVPLRSVRFSSSGIPLSQDSTVESGLKGGLSQGSMQGLARAQPERTGESTPEKTLSARPEPKDSDSMLDEMCLLIYDAYPKKVGRPAAIRAIRSAIGRELSPILLSKTRDYAAAVKGKDPRYIPHPATWFNQERYNDDPATWNPDAARSERHVRRDTTPMAKSLIEEDTG